MVDRNVKSEDRNIDAIASSVIDGALRQIEQAFPDDPEAQRACSKEVADRLRAGMLGRQQGLYQ